MNDTRPHFSLRSSRFARSSLFILLEKPHLGFAVLATLAGVAYTFVTPPFQVPDEVGHYWRGASMGSGLIEPHLTSHGSAAAVPAGVRDLVKAAWVEPRALVAPHDAARRWRAAWSVPLQRDRQAEVSFPAFYTPVPSMAGAVAYSLGNAARLRPVVTFYLGRLANVFLYVALVSTAISWAPGARSALFAAAAMPMPLFLAGSWSTDTTTTAVAFLLVTLVLRLLQRESAVTARELGGLALLILVSGACKGVYAATGLIAFALPPRRFGTGRRAAAAYAILALAIAAGFALSATTARRSFFEARASEGVSLRQQTRVVTSQPARFALLVGRDVRRHALSYLAQMVGRLGWLNVSLPSALIAAELLILVLATACSSLSAGPAVRLLALLALAAGAAAVCLSQYLIWTPVGSTALEGVQGRYFLPLVPLAIVAMAGPWQDSRLLRAAVVLLACGGNVIGIAAIWAHYY